MTRLIAVLIVGVTAGPAWAQVAPASSRPAPADPQPLYRVTVVGRTTAAINYRPRSGSTKVDLVGTALLPGARGSAEVSGKKGYVEIEARVDRMADASHFGREYLTYVLWAITPEGRPKNLGELQVHRATARVEVTTELQAFGLIVTAEPYFAVSQPSDVVVLENAVRGADTSTVDTVQAKYDLLRRGSYLRDRGASFAPKPLEAGAPLDLAEARNAIELARIAEADQYASDTFAKATRLLDEAETARAQRKRGGDIMLAARKAAQTAEDARLIALQRQEDAFNARHRVVAAQRERAALERAEAAEAGRQQAEQAATAAQDAADAELQQARMLALRAQAAAAVAEQEKKELRDRLREQLNAFLDTRETARGLIMNVPDVLFETASARLTAEARERLARVSGILASHPDLHIAVEGHTDDVGNAAENQKLSDRRASGVLAYLVEQKIPLAAVDTEGFGESRPIASNATQTGRQRNRRVELVVTGDSIGREDGRDERAQ